MSEWNTYKLIEAAFFQRGHDLTREKMKSGSYPVGGSNGVIGFHNDYTCNGPGITIGRSGNIGTPHFYKSQFWAHNTVLYTKEFRLAEPLYLYYNLKTIDFSQFNAGSSVPTLNRNHIHELDITLPSLPEQKAIASVLSSLDDKIDLLHRQNQTLEAMAETLLKEWFVEGKNNTLMYYGDLVNSVSVKHSFDTDKVVFLNTSDIYNGHVLVHEYKEVRGLPGQAKKSIRKGDILFTEIRPANKRFAFINFDANDYVVSTKLMVLRSKGLISNSILYLYLKWLPNLEYLQMLAESRSGTFPQITFDDLKTIEINIPPQGIMDNLTPIFNSIIAKTFSNYDQIQTLTKLRDTLLPKLMSGEVRVKI